MITRFVLLAWRDIRRLATRAPCHILLVLGLGNLLGGLLIGDHIAPATPIMLEAIYANFGFVIWAIIIYASGVPAVRDADGMPAGVVVRAAALAGIIFALLTGAGLVAVGFQLQHGYPPAEPLRLPLYAGGLYFNVGGNALHLAALAIFIQAVVGSRWPAMVATAILYLGSNYAFEHVLIRFGAPVSPWSDMNGYGPFLTRQIAAGIYWTAFCMLLLVGAHLAARHRRIGQRPRPSPNVASIAWAATVVWLVTGAWIFHNLKLFDGGDHHAALTAGPKGRHPGAENRPWPEYLRLDLEVDVQPEARRLRSRGVAILVNRGAAAIPEVRFILPRRLVAHSLSLTGELTAGGPSLHTPRHSRYSRYPRYPRYRLNRPLEPGETLRVEFDLEWNAADLGDISRELTSAGPGPLSNGTLVSTADVIPLIDTPPSRGDNRPSRGDNRPPRGMEPDARHSAWFATSSRVAFRARIGTALDQIAVAPGVLVREWKENGRRYFEYRSEQPISLLAPIHSGRYAVIRDTWNGVAIEAYHHPPHRHRLPRLMAAARNLLACQGASAPYPYRQLRVVEVPDYRSLARPPAILAFGWRRDWRPRWLANRLALSGVVPYSERAGLSNWPAAGADGSCSMLAESAVLQAAVVFAAPKVSANWRRGGSRRG